MEDQLIIPGKEIANSVFYRLRLDDKRAQAIQENKPSFYNTAPHTTYQSATTAIPYKVLASGFIRVTDNSIRFLLDHKVEEGEWCCEIRFIDIDYIIIYTNYFAISNDEISILIVANEYTAMLYKENYNKR